MLELDLLGPPQVYEGTHQLTFRTQKALALLVYLAVTGTPQSRAHLAALLWPDRAEERARATLRSTLRLLREALASSTALVPSGASGEMLPHLTARLLHGGRDHLGREALWLQSAGSEDILVIDLHLIQQAISLTAQRPGPSTTDLMMLRSQLEAAATRCRGSFLADFSLDDAPDFMDWVEQQRAYWQGKTDHLFQTLSALQIQQGAFAGAIQTAEQWAQNNPLSEEACYALMEAQAATGETATALATFWRYRELLARSLEIEPSPDLVAFAERLRRASTRNGLASSEQVKRLRHRTCEPVQRTTPEAPLVGREREFSLLVAVYERACQGNVQLVHLVGEEGIGKTRLAEEFLHWAGNTQGAIVLSGRAFETAAQLPYQPLVEAVRARLAQERAPEDLLDDVWLAELSRILPDLRERYPDLALLPGEGSEARGRLFEAVAQLGLALTRPHHTGSAVNPLVLLLDDFHWADASARDLLWFLSQRWNEEHHPVLILLVVRQEEVSTSRDLREWLHDLHRIVQTALITLGALDEAATHELIRQLFAADTPRLAEIAHWFQMETGGQPLYTVQMLRALLEQGWLTWETQATGEERLVAPTFEPGARLFHHILPLTMKAVIQQRLERLTPTASRWLTAAAVLGTRFQPEQAWRLAELDELTGLDALEEAEHRLIVRVLADGELYTFTHDLLREVVYTGIGEVRRRILHRRAFEILEHNHATAASLAHHAWIARLLEPAFHYSVEAGHAAFSLFAVRSALAHYERAWYLLGKLTVASKVPGSLWEGTRFEPAEAEREQLATQLGRAYEWISALDQANSVYTVLRRYAREHGKLVLEATALNRQAAVIWQQTWDFTRARTLLDEAFTISKQSGDLLTMAETAWNQGQIAQWANDSEVALAHANHALELARSVQCDELTARSLYLIGRIHNITGQWDQGVEPIRQSRAIYATLGSQSLPQTMRTISQSTTTAEMWELGMYFLWTGIPPVNSLDYRMMEADCLDLLAMCELNRGQPHAAIEAGQQGVEIASQTNNAMAHALNMNKLQIALAEVGAYQDALRVAQKAQTALVTAHDTALRWMLLFTLADAQNTLLQLEEARVTLSEAAGLVESIPIGHWKNAIFSRLCANRVLARDWPAALTAALQALASREAAPTNLLWLDFHRPGEIAALLHGGDVALAQKETQRFGTQVGTNPRFQLIHQQMLAVLAHADGSFYEAIAHAQNALALAEALDLPGEQWQIEADLVWLYQATGQEILAQQMLAQARAVIHHLAASLSDSQFSTPFLTAAQHLLLASYPLYH